MLREENPSLPSPVTSMCHTVILYAFWCVEAGVPTLCKFLRFTGASYCLRTSGVTSLANELRTTPLLFKWQPMCTQARLLRSNSYAQVPAHSPSDTFSSRAGSSWATSATLGHKMASNSRSWLPIHIFYLLWHREAEILKVRLVHKD